MAQSKSTSKVYESLSVFLSTREYLLPSAGAVQLANLAARAYASGEAAEGARLSKASLESLKGFAKSEGYTVDITSGDVLGMAVVAPYRTKSGLSPEEVYMERLVRFGRATRVNRPKADGTEGSKAKSPKVKTTTADDRITTLETSLAQILALLQPKAEAKPASKSRAKKAVAK